MEIKSIESAMEAILFASGESISIEKIAQAMEIDRQTAAKIMDRVMERLNGGDGGIKIIRADGSYQMVTNEKYAEYVRSALEIRRNMPLTQASMEVLSIVAYRQPVTKGYIEQVRGVECSGIINNLLDKHLIEERGRMEVPGRPILYGTTFDFLRCFGLASLQDLPDAEAAVDETAQS